ncbi:MAG: DUF2339 domain-containing protein [Candidatus Hydrogenedentes bacterium]|nr:DUF2339 domain-containing protein [Candidatus Hydrogenedentota bacterium]
MPSGWEMSLGTYLLPRIALVLGAIAAVYFLGTAMERWGPHTRVAIGYAVCLGFLGTGWWLEGRYPLYARILYSGGLAMSYFVTFAAHFIEYARIIESIALGLALLAVVVVFWAFVAHIRRSITVAYLVTFLGHLTVMLATIRGEHLAPYSIAGIVVLALGNAYFLLRHRWYYVAVLGLAGCYANHVVWALTVESRGLARDFWISTGFLASYFAIYAVTEFFTPEAVRRKAVPTWFRTLFLTANSAAFFAIGSATVYHFENYSRGHQDIFSFCFALALTLLGLAYLRWRERDPLFNAYLAKAVTVATLGLAARYGSAGGEHAELSPWLAVETVALLYSARRSGLVVTRVLAFFVALVAFFYTAFVTFALPAAAYGSDLYWRFVVQSLLTVAGFLVASVLYQRTDWSIRSPRTLPVAQETLGLFWQLDLISERPPGAMPRPYGGLQFPFIYAIGGAVLYVTWLRVLFADGDRSLPLAVLTFALTLTAAWLASRPLGLAAMILSVTTLALGTYEISAERTAPAWLAMMATAFIFSSAVRSDRRLVQTNEGLVFHQHDVGAYLLYAATGLLGGCLLVREFTVAGAPTAHAAAALAGAACIAAALTQLLHRGALTWTATGLLLWASWAWLIGGDLRTQYTWHFVAFAVAIIALSLDRYVARLRLQQEVGPAGSLLIVAAAIVLARYIDLVAAPGYRFAWFALLAFGFLGYGLVYREIIAGAVAIIGAACASVWLVDYSYTPSLAWQALVADSLLLTAFWLTCERIAARWRSDGSNAAVLPLRDLLPYAAAALLVHLPWRVPLEGAYLTSSWTVLAFLLVAISLPFRQDHYRYAGLAVFALAIGRAFVDINSALSGFNKSAAFAVLCFVLLVVAYGYHRAMLHITGGPHGLAGQK